jgi:hypothetical protein
MTLPAVEAFLREAFLTIDATEGEPHERPVELRLVFDAARLTDASTLAADLRRITRKPVRIRPAPLRRRWTVTLVAPALPMTLPLVRLCERRLHDLVRFRPGCRFLGRHPAPGRSLAG